MTQLHGYGWQRAGRALRQACVPDPRGERALPSDATIGRHNKPVNAVWLHCFPCWAGLLLFWYLGPEHGV